MCHVLSNDMESYKVKQLSFEKNTTLFLRLCSPLKKVWQRQMCIRDSINGLTDKGTCGSLR